MCPNRPGRRRIFVASLVVALLGPVWPAHAAEQRQEVSKSFDRTIAVNAGQRLRLENSHGDVQVTTHPRTDLRVQATIRASADSRDAAAEFLNSIDVDVTEAAAAINVRTRYPDKAWWRTRRNLSYSVDYVVLMPERTPLELRNSFGNVSVTGVKADAAIVNGHGTLTVSDGAGRHTLENSFGSIEASRIAGDVTVTNANGDVGVTTVSGALNVTDRFGRVAVNGVRGAALITNSNGQVDILDAASANVTNSFGLVIARNIRGPLVVANSNGEVKVDNAQGTATIKTSFGSLEATGITGAVTATNNNGAVILRNVGGDAEVRGSFGQIEVTDAKGSVRVTSGNNGVRIVNAGGAVYVKTSFGLVSVEGANGSATIDNQNGGVEITSARGVEVRTTFGPVVVRNIEGKVTVRNQNGAIDATSIAKPRTCHDISLTTTFAPIHVRLPDAGYTVTAETSFGAIRSDIPVTASGALGEGRLSGTIGGGGCPLQLINANGDIIIRR